MWEAAAATVDAAGRAATEPLRAEVGVEVEVTRVLTDPSTRLSSVPSGLRPVMFEVGVGVRVTRVLTDPST